MGIAPTNPTRYLFVTRAGAADSGGAISHSASEAFHVQVLGAERHAVHYVSLPAGGALIRKVKTFLGLRKGHLSGVNDRTITNFVRHLDAIRPEVVVFDSSLFGPLAQIAKQRGCIVITQCQNCEFDYFSGEAAIRGGLAGELLHGAYLAEKMAVEASDLLLTLSAHDRQRLSKLYDQCCPTEVVNPNLAALLQRLQSVNAETKSVVPIGKLDELPMAIFLGSDSHQNRLACQQLLKCWKGDYARLMIVGRVGLWLQQHFSNDALSKKNVSVVGYVPSLTQTLSTANVMTCPMTLGSGIKIKVIDALAHACPVLVSEEAAIGFEFAFASGFLIPCQLDDMEAVTAKIRRSNFDFGTLLRDTRTEVDRHSANLHKAYATLGILKARQE
jgi:hypothetical protein